MKKNNLKKLRIISFFLVLIFFAFAIWKLFPIFKTLTTVEGRNTFSEKIFSLGLKGHIILCGMLICKVLVIFLPGEPIELLAGMCYGPFLGLLVLYIGYFLSTLIIILAVKKFGIDLVKDVVPEEKFNKVQTMFKNNPQKIELTLFVLYFIPVLPKDFITYIASLLPLSNKRILSISLIARIPSVLSSTIVGSKILSGDIFTIIIVYSITYSISLIIAGIYKKVTKTKQEKN